MKTHGYKTVTSLLALSVLAAACGSFKTNPTEGYDDVRNAGRPYQVTSTPTPTPVPQLVADSVFRRPSVENDSVALNFEEGKTTSYVFDAGCFFPGVGYNLILKNLPGATLTRSTDPARPDQFVLAWAPKKGTIANGEHGHRSIVVQIMYEITATPNAEAAAQVAPLNHKEYSYQLNLFNNEQDPEITKLNVQLGGLDTIVQGDKVAITVEATDPGAYADRVPTLKIEDDNGGATDANVMKSASSVTLSGPKFVDGKFIFDLMFDSSKVVIPTGSAEVTARFKVYVKGVAGFQSAALPVNIKVQAKPTPAPAATPVPSTNDKTGAAVKPAATPKPQPSATPKPAGAQPATMTTPKNGSTK